MRRSANETIRNLEDRIARLENSTSRRTKSAAKTAKLSNARAIIMVDDREYEEDKINLCFMHMNRAILKRSVEDFKTSINQWPHSQMIEDFVTTSECESCICITVKISDPSFWGEDLLDSGHDWISETITNLPNSIPAK
jgi:hypothetical protein